MGALRKLIGEVCTWEFWFPGVAVYFAIDMIKENDVHTIWYALGCILFIVCIEMRINLREKKRGTKNKVG